MLARFENDLIDIDQARVELASEKPKAKPNLELLKDQLSQTQTFIDILPLPVISREKQATEFSDLLQKLKDSIDLQLRLLGKV